MLIYRKYESRNKIRDELNKRVGETVNYKDFQDLTRASSYLSRLQKDNKGYVEKVACGQYKILKKIENPVIIEPDKLIKSDSRETLRNELNKRINEIVDTRQFTDCHLASNYFSVLSKRGFVERINRGQYKIIKKIKLKRRGAKKGTKRYENYKDLSMIPTILTSSNNGLGMSQIQNYYYELTPENRQVNKNYLYRLLKFGFDKGVIKIISKDKSLRTGTRGPIPKRWGLTNPNLTIEEWNDCVEEYRRFYQYQKDRKLNKVSPKTIEQKFNNSSEIIDAFEERDNPNKQMVEDYFLKVVEKYLDKNLIDCLIISGPDYNRHISKVFSKIANHVTICEKERDIFKSIYRKACICPFYLNNQVSLINADVHGFYKDNCRYIDLDLMATIRNIKPIILKQLKNQIKTCDEIKFFTFTVSLRNDGGEKIRIEQLKEILYESFEVTLDGLGMGDDIENEFVESKKYGFCREFLPEVQDYHNVKELIVMEYKDTTPMISVLIVYE
jgi:hypothetical protein